MSIMNYEPFGLPEEEASEEESGEEEESEHSILIDVDNDFNADGYKVPRGPFMPTSAPNLEGLSEAAITRLLQGMSDYDLEDLFNKNTESFRCLAQTLMSRSSLMRHILYHFPVLEDPGIDEAFTYVEPEQTFDDVGAAKYRQLCKDMNIAPISRVVRSLNTETLNLKYYGLSDKQFKAICNCVMLNTHIKTLILEDNWISPEAALWLCEMLRENNSINFLSLRECRLGPKGMEHCVDGFSLNQSVREIDLSFNDLGDEGVEILTGALKDNYNVDKLNLSHNHLGELSGKLLGELLREHTNIDFLDVSWNDLYVGKALAYLFHGIAEGDSLEFLNLSWNGIGAPETVGPITKYLKATQKLQHLDLSFNRVMDKAVAMLTAGLKENASLKSINLGFNLITPTDVIKLTSILTSEHPLEFMDLQNVYVNKNFIPIWQKLTDMGKSVRIEGILENYSITGPDRRKVAFDRCRYLAQKPKQKKLRKDFGSEFIWNLPEEIVDNSSLQKLVKKSRIKLDSDLIDFLGDTFSAKKKKIDLKAMRDAYLELYPDTQPPPSPKRKSKKKKKGRKSTKEPVATEEKGIGTDSLQLDSMQNDDSSLVTSRMAAGPNALIRLSRITQEMADESPSTEQVMSTVNLDGKESRKTITIASIASLRESRSRLSTKVALSRRLHESTTNEPEREHEDSMGSGRNRLKSIAFLDEINLE